MGVYSQGVGVWVVGLFMGLVSLSPRRRHGAPSDGRGLGFGKQPNLAGLLKDAIAGAVLNFAYDGKEIVLDLPPANQRHHGAFPRTVGVF